MLGIFGVGFPAGRGFAVPNAIPLGSAFWAPGGYWDLRALVTGEHGSTQTAGLTSQVSANVISPTAAPTLSSYGIGGNRCLHFNATSQYLRCDALAALVTGSDKPWTLAIRYRSTGTGTQALMSAGSSAGATDNFLQVRSSTLQKTEIRKDAASEATITRTATADQQYDDHVLVVSSNGTTVSAWLDGVADALDSSALDALSISVDRFVFGALLASSASQYFQGFIQCVAFTSNVAIEADAIALNAAWRAGDFTDQKSESTQIMFSGDSITQGDSGNNAGGFRDWIADYIVSNGLSLDAVGSRAQGLFPDRQHSAQGGLAIASIASLNVTDLATRNPSLILNMMGTNNMDDVGGASAALTAYQTALGDIFTAAVARKSTVRISVTTILPIQTGQAGWDQVATFNAGLPAIWDAFDAAHPSNTLIRWDAHAAIGGAWSSTYFGADPVHPNDAGYALLGAALIAAVAPTLRGLSSTLAPLSCNILTPVGGATLTNGVPATITGTVSRTTASVVIKDDQGDTWGTATVSAPDAMSPNCTWSLTSYTPVSGDLGARTLHAEATDAIGGATASSADVAVTVAEPSYTYADSGTLVLWNDMMDATAHSETGADTTSLKNKVTGIFATEATKPPAYEATGGPNSHPCFTLDKTNSEQLISATDSTAAGWLVGSQKPFTWVGYVKLVNLSDTVFWFSIAGSATANQGLHIGQQTTNKWRCFRQDSAANTSNINPTSPATASGWHRVAWRFDGTNNYLSIDGGAETATAAPLAGSIAGCNRWGWGCRADSVPDTFGSVSVAEAVLYSEDIGTTNLADVLSFMASKWAA